MNTSLHRLVLMSAEREVEQCFLSNHPVQIVTGMPVGDPIRQLLLFMPES